MSMNVVDQAMQLTNAPLPAIYEESCRVLAECLAIDECVDWADKAAALASYARQSDDKTLENYAMRIRSRAIRRAGELLKEFDAPGKRTDLEPIDGGDKRLTQKQAGDDAGMSDRQRTTAVQVANVPAAEFEAAVESENPPTVTGLAETGKQSRPQKDAPPGFAQATQFIGTIDQLAQFCAANPPAVIANALLAHERASTQESVAAVVIWLGDFNLEFELGGNDARPADR